MQRLTTLEQRAELMTLPDWPVVVYKHNSNQCPISARILPQIESFADEFKHLIVAVDIIEHREVSNILTEQAKIIHESPQCIIFDEEWRCINACSHGRIKPEWISSVFDSLDQHEQWIV